MLLKVVATVRAPTTNERPHAGAWIRHQKQEPEPFVLLHMNPLMRAKGGQGLMALADDDVAQGDR